MAPDGVGGGARCAPAKRPADHFDAINRVADILLADWQLVHRITEHLTEVGRPLTATEIAKGIKARKADVLRALSVGDPFYLWPTYDRRKLYGVMASPNGRTSAPRARERTKAAQYVEWRGRLHKRDRVKGA